ncbi:5730_t:CDS:10, partial [Acaulospora morrowiae]
QDPYIMVDEDDVCRVCRSEGTEEQPLFHPCKCAGSIRFVHQDCLTEWLKHSKKKYCEVCKYPFSFTPIYDPRMPESIPVVLFVRRGARRIYGLIQIWFRAILVGIVWLIILPYITVWVWRFFFWSGETVAFSINGQKPPILLPESNGTIIEKSSLSVLYVSILKGTLWYAPPEAVEFVEAYGEFTSKFFADTFEGQIITCIVVIVFVAGFLLREWIIQNTPPEDGLENEMMGIEENDVIPNDVENNLRDIQNPLVLPDVAQIPEQNVNRVEPIIQVAENQNIGNFIFDNGNRLPLVLPPANGEIDHQQLQEPVQLPQINIQESDPQHIENDEGLIETSKSIQVSDVEPEWINDDMTISKTILNPVTSTQDNRVGEDIDEFSTLELDRKTSADEASTVQANAFVASDLDAGLIRESLLYDETNEMPNKIFDLDRETSPVVGGLDQEESSIADEIECETSSFNNEIDKKDMKQKKPINFSQKEDFPENGESHQKSQSFGFPISNPQFEFNLPNHVREEDPVDDIISNLSTSSKSNLFSNQTSTGHVTNNFGNRRIRPIRKARTKVGSSNSGSGSSQSNQKSGSASSSPDEFEDISGSSIDLDFFKTASGKGLISDNSGDYDDTPEVSDSEDSEDVNLQEKYPRRRTGKSYSPSKIITNNSAVYRTDDPNSFSLLGSKHSSTSSMIHIFRKDEPEYSDADEVDHYEDDDDDGEDHDSEGDLSERENAEEEPFEAMGNNNMQPEPVPDANDNQQQPRQERQEGQLWLQFRNWFAEVFNDMLGPNVDIGENDQQAVNDEQVDVNPLAAPAMRAPNVEAPGAPALIFNEAIDAPLVGQGFLPFGDGEDEEEENVANEDLEGVLEAIGMRGSLWMLAQNSVLMAVLISICLAGSIWLPYVVGKTVLLVKPLKVIQLPLALLRYVTDPLVDLVIDTTLPWIWSIIFPILKSGWDATKLLFPIVKDSSLMVYLQDITNKTQDFVAYSASFMTDISPNASNVTLQNITSIENTNIQHITEFLKGRNLTVIVKIIERCDGFAYGNTPTDKIVCILFGYAIVILLCAWYLTRTRNAYGRTVGRAFQEVLRQQGIVLKVAFFVAIELVIFPIICGILLDLSTLPLFPDATPSTRLEFYFESPITSTFLHWFTGTAFMFHFAVFVSLCREIVRHGVMWFIRDPNDPQFHPIKEILERPVWTQLKKIGASGIMYSAMIVLGLGSVIYFIRYAFNGILPLQLSFTEPISEFPIDLLIFHIVVPVTFTLAKPKRLFRTLFENWWHITSHQLRLTSFMFGGERRYDEEGTHVRKTWRAFFLNLKAPLDGTNDENDEVVFVRDGTLVKAPGYDGVPVIPGKRMLIPVNEDGTLQNPEDAPDDDLGYTIVYTPPNFKARVILFLFLMWLCGSLFCCSVTVVPLLIGRFVFKSFNHERPVHDLYTFTVGLYIMWSLGVSFEWLMRKFQAIIEKRDHDVDWAVVRQKIWQSMILILKIAYLLVAFGVVIPLLLSLVIELYILHPWKKPTADLLSISYLQNWALGIVYVKIAYRIIFMLPDNIYSRAINEITERGIRHLNVGLATNVFIIPVGGSALAAVILPALTASLIINITAIKNAVTIAMIHRCIYPIFLVMIFGYRLQRQTTQIVQNWMQTVRDEEYLIGRRLHNIEPNEENVSGSSRNVSAGSVAD